MNNKNFFIPYFLGCTDSNAAVYKKESVELFVYLTTGIWRGPSTNKQYPTPNSIYRNDICLCTVMSVCIAYPYAYQNRQILSSRISETLSLNNMSLSVRQYYKFRKCFAIRNTFRGIVIAKFIKTMIFSNRCYGGLSFLLFVN